jgi:hypothetical protein
MRELIALCGGWRGVVRGLVEGLALVGFAAAVYAVASLAGG